MLVSQRGNGVLGKWIVSVTEGSTNSGKQLELHPSISSKLFRVHFECEEGLLA